MHDEKDSTQNIHQHAPLKPHSEMKKAPSFREDVIRFAFIFLVIIVPFRLFVAQPFVVSGASMDPTFHSGDYLIVDQISPKIGSGWQRFDVVVFKFPFQKSRYLIKRIIGLPGETVVIENGVVSIVNDEFPNGIKLDEPYITHELKDSHTVTLGEHDYFVMGDNRSGSYDSRQWGPLSEDLLVGEPLVRLFPFNVIDIKPGHTTSS
ncbi:MAG: signal peptidase I [Candidatus Zambryskibacteria bacterium CG10_big_fil_rev_8_21_14_0_10_42_12]|uniref:Signal peptidase I n=1 Tax=Candidatus Zambryskibacteria bacterium CG10_big_fil_rev_8_21_14_0_10_42_12 TaxID=1975115 RepID=A0A2H0QVC1_9BACT|nr:MAG: signal peptidase I [Candidatus Zambryskibacteria bacterium CG10_big_fil_rev_8_21_14_0_10_42_12]